MRKFLHRVLPHHDTVVKNRWLKPFARWLAEPNLWCLHRRSVAGGVAIGLFCGLIPGPLQMIGAALIAVLLRVNLPVALFVTLYTNPFTIVPLYLLAYRLGAQATGVNGGLSNPPFPELQWQNMGGELWVWLMQLGKPLLIGLPLLASGLALIGYVAVRLAWRGGVLLKWRARRRKRL